MPSVTKCQSTKFAVQLHVWLEYPKGLRTFRRIGLTVSAQRSGEARMPNLNQINENARQVILRAKATIRRSQETLRVSREVQADRDRAAERETQARLYALVTAFSVAS